MTHLHVVRAHSEAPGESPVLRTMGSHDFLVFPRRPADRGSLVALNPTMALLYRRLRAGDGLAAVEDRMRDEFRVPPGTDLTADLRAAADELEALLAGPSQGAGAPAPGPPTDDEVLKLVEAEAWREGLPLNGSIETTWNCNFACVHCYVRTPRKRELGVEDWCRILDDLATADCLYLSISGGEPTLYRDFPEVYRYAKEKGFVVTLLTNGSLLDETLAELLWELPPQRIEMSVYGASPRTCDEVTGSRQAFSQVSRALEILDQLRGRTRVKLKSVLMKQNVADRESVQRLAREHSFEMSEGAAVYPRTARVRTWNGC